TLVCGGNALLRNANTCGARLHARLVALDETGLFTCWKCKKLRAQSHHRQLSAPHRRGNGLRRQDGCKHARVRKCLTVGIEQRLPLSHLHGDSEAVGGVDAEQVNEIDVFVESVCQQVRQLPRLGFELRHARAASLRSLLAAGLLPVSLLAVSLLAVSLLAVSLLVWRRAFHGSGVAGDATAGPRIRVALR